MTDLLKAVGLTKEQVQNSKCIISIAPHASTTAFCKYAQRNLESGLTCKGKPRKQVQGKHPDLAHLKPGSREYNKEVCRRWRAAHPKGAPSGSKVKA